MNRPKLFISCLCSALLVNSAAGGQTRSASPLSVSFTDPDRPGFVRVGVLRGSIRVTGYEGKTVIIEARPREVPGSERSLSREGSRRQPDTSAGLSIKEEDNVVSISDGVTHRTIDLVLQVPTHTSLKVTGFTEGDVAVGNLEGEIDINTTNGNITLTDIAGSVVAYSENGKISAGFVRVDPHKAISLSSLVGNIDVALPPDVRAAISMHTEHGTIDSDFEMQFRASVKPKIEQVWEPAGQRGVRLKYRTRVERTLNATLNGGGGEIHLRSFKGDINIRKGKG
jgi:hypothetical protein